MLAVFHHTLAEPPAELKHAERGEQSGPEALNSFKEANPEATTFQFGNAAAISYTHDGEHFACPRQFATADEIFCLFAGNLENLSQLKQVYGLTRNVNEVQMVIEAYKVLRDRGPYSANQVVGDLQGAFTFVLFDSRTKKLFIAQDMSGKVPFCWGTCSDGSLLVSSEASLLRQLCGQSFAPFPKGCYFSTDSGLKSYTDPKKSLKPMPHVDSFGHMCGATFKVEVKAEIAERKQGPWLGSF